MDTGKNELTRRGALGLVGAGTLTALTAPSALAAGWSPGRWRSQPNATPGMWSGDLWAPYVADGTVFTRSVATMPLASNSAALAARMPSLPTNHFGVVTSLNTTAYNIPTYVVDSTVRGCPTVSMRVTRALPSGSPCPQLDGRIPLPPWAKPADGGDRSMAVYDRGTGLMREYFLCAIGSDGTWTAGYGGYYQAAPGFTNLRSANYPMQLTQGSSAVVSMLNPLMQVGISEARNGRINHALDFTISNALRGSSWPAKQGDGTDANPNTPAEGQWFRIPPGLNLKGLKLRPFTLLLAQAAQNYGGMAGDKNLFCHAFNVEHPVNAIHNYRQNPWTTDILSKYGSLDVNDFPWALTQWAPLNWGRP
ncbi:hypothetical protein V3G39_03450 [Dermatophilaceae bacterium Sec6.4]